MSRKKAEGYWGCFSPENLWCGFTHYSLKRAQACCYRSKNDYSEFRIPVECKSGAEVRALKIHPEVQERSDMVREAIRNGGPAPKIEKQESKGKAPEGKGEKASPESLGTLTAAIEVIAKEAAASIVDARTANYVDTATLKSSVKEGIEKAIAPALKEALAQERAELLRVEIPHLEIEKEIKNEHPLFPKLLGELALGHSVFIAGGAGSGKTTAAENAAKVLELTSYMMPSFGTRYEALGFIGPNGDYNDTPIYRWAASEQGGVLILDEIDRTPAKALPCLHSALANGTVVFPHKEIRIGSKHLVIATANSWGIGADVDYTAAGKLDAATLDRFQARMAWEYDEAFELELAVTKSGGTVERVAFCQALRASIHKAGIQTVWSPRSTFAYCVRRAAGLSHADALALSVLSTLKPDQQSKTLKGVKEPA